MAQVDTVAAIPPEVSQLALTHQLGNHRLTLPAAKRLRLILAVGIFAVLIGGFGLVMALDATMAETGRPVGWVLFVLSVAVFGWVFSTSPIVSAKARAREFYLYDQGFVHPGRKGTRVYRYDQVRQLWAALINNRVNGISTGTQYRYRLVFGDNSVLKLNNYSTDMDRFGQILQHEVSRAQIAAWLPTLNAGQPIGFGPFAVSRAGLQAGNKPLVPWAEISNVRVVAGYVRVDKAGKFLSLAAPKAADVPNLGTFLTLADALRTGQL